MSKDFGEGDKNKKECHIDHTMNSNVCWKYAKIVWIFLQ